MFDENNITEEQKTELPETLLEENEPEINNDSEADGYVDEEDETAEETPISESEAAQIESARARALAQVQRLSNEAGFSGPWSNLFRKYPALSRESAYTELGDAVKGGLTPLEAYQQKLLSEQETELRIARESSAAAMRSVGSLSGDGGEREIDDFLAGFYSV